MTAEQKSEFMTSVRWTTVIYCAIAIVPMLIAFIWFLSGIKADVTATRVDVKDARTEAREQLTAAVNSINRRIDSTQYKQNSDIQAIWVILNNKGYKAGSLHYYNEKIINGQTVLVPSSK